MTDANDNVTSLREANIVLLGIKVFVHEISEYLSAVKAVGEIQKDIGKEEWTENIYLVLAEDAIWRQLISSITKVFDNDKTGKYYNCSLKLLKELCLEEKKQRIFPKGKDDSLMRAIDSLYDKYNSIVSLHVRNKKVAHHDLNSLFSSSVPYILFSDVEDLVNETIDLISKIGERLWVVPLEFPPVLSENYKEAILKLINDGEKPYG